MTMTDAQRQIDERIKTHGNTVHKKSTCDECDTNIHPYLCTGCDGNGAWTIDEVLYIGGSPEHDTREVVCRQCGGTGFDPAAKFTDSVKDPSPQSSMVI